MFSAKCAKVYVVPEPAQWYMPSSRQWSPCIHGCIFSFAPCFPRFQLNLLCALDGSDKYTPTLPAFRKIFVISSLYFRSVLVNIIQRSPRQRYIHLRDRSEAAASITHSKIMFYISILLQLSPPGSHCFIRLTNSGLHLCQIRSSWEWWKCRWLSLLYVAVGRYNAWWPSRLGRSFESHG